MVEALKRKLGDLYDGSSLVVGALGGIPAKSVMKEIEGRLQYTLEKDFKLRHGAVLRRPGDLSIHRGYSRPEIVNHFLQQYDPAKHNTGVLQFDIEGARHFVIITKLDTAGAVANHQYRNEFLGHDRFSWSSQNRQNRTSGSGREVVEHRENGSQIHLFVQPSSHAKAVYLGPVDVGSAKGDEPIRFVFHLREATPQSVLDQLLGS